MTKLQQVIFHSTISYPKKNHEEDKRGRQVMSCHSDLESLLKILYLPWISHLCSLCPPPCPGVIPFGVGNMMGRPLEPHESCREYRTRGGRRSGSWGRWVPSLPPISAPRPPGTYFTLDKAGPIGAPRTPNLMESEPNTFLWSQGKVWRVEEEWAHAWRSACRKGWKVVSFELWTTPGFLASGGDEFDPEPVTRLDRSEILCNKVLLTC